MIIIILIKKIDMKVKAKAHPMLAGKQPIGRNL